ncbi:MAG: MFS transporter, partial [Gemmatimonadetes bacterium]|nr:MFS transporter [Gemmatimonadota bacterium]
MSEANSDAGAGGAVAATPPAAAAPPALAPAVRRPREGMRVMLGLSAGHSIQHFYQQTLLLLLPHIKAELLLSDPAMGAIMTVRSIGSGVMNVPAGILADMFRRRVALLLTVSMSCLTLGYLFVGIAPRYWLILLAITLAGAGTSMWHAPSFSTLSARYPDRRGLALALHRSGGSIGDTIAPVVVGLLLGGVSFWGLNWGGFSWRTVALLHVGPSALTGLLIIATFKSGAVAAPGRVSLKEYALSALPLLKNPRVMGI